MALPLRAFRPRLTFRARIRGKTFPFFGERNQRIGHRLHRDAAEMQDDKGGPEPLRKIDRLQSLPDSALALVGELLEKV